ncbi:MAG: DNRLRE domain-containing protein [Bacteroidota bacterium]
MIKKIYITQFLIPLIIIGSQLRSISQTTITLQPGSAEGKDAVVFSLPNSVNTNYGDRIYIFAWSWGFSNIHGDYRSYLDFDLSSLPASSFIINATLTLTSDSVRSLPYGHSTLSGSNAASLRRVISSWDENTITWNNQPASTAANQVILPQSSYIDQDYDVDVTALVQDMADNPVNSYGFMLQLVTEQGYRSLIFASSDNDDPARHPKLTITYNPDTIHTLSGEIYAGSSLLTDGMVYLYDTSGDSADTPFDSIAVDSGVYTFTNVYTGDYIIYAVPGDNDTAVYYPAYYVNAIYWNDAYAIPVHADVGNVIIDLVPKGINSIYNAGQENDPLLVYPNPFYDVVNLIIDEDSEEVIDIRLYDVLGQLVCISSGHKAGDKISFGNNLYPGIFVVEVKQGGLIYKKRIIKNSDSH